jgi:hypothetical protein
MRCQQLTVVIGAGGATGALFRQWLVCSSVPPKIQTTSEVRQVRGGALFRQIEVEKLDLRANPHVYTAIKPYRQYKFRILSYSDDLSGIVAMQLPSRLITGERPGPVASL